MESLLAAVPVVAITLPIMRIFAEVDATLRERRTRLPTSDLLIASTGLLRGDEVVTGNARHFRSVPALTIHDQPS